MDNEIRRLIHQKKAKLEDLIHLLNGLMAKEELGVINSLEWNEKPIILILGCARSGSTILFQSLSNTGIFCYPSNIISRFPLAPYIGGVLHKIIVEHDYFDEFGFNTSNYKSNLGKTKGASQPHEFWYFWRRFFEFDFPVHILKKYPTSEEASIFMNELNGLTSLFNKPLLMKGMIMNWELEYLSKISDRFKFIFIERDLIANAVSLIGARVEFFGDVNRWYSFLPPGASDMSEYPVEVQVVEQVKRTNGDILKQFEKIDDNRILKIKYEDLILSPDLIINEIVGKFGLSGAEVQNDGDLTVSENAFSFDRDFWGERVTDYFNSIK